MKDIYTAHTTLDFGMYKGYDLGIVYVFDPNYIQWCIINIDNFCVEKLTELQDYKIMNETANWQHRMIGDPSTMPLIDVFDSFQELLDNEERIKHLSKDVKFEGKKFSFSENAIKRNNDKIEELYGDGNEDDYEDDDFYYDSYDDDSDCCPACFQTLPCDCNYALDRI